MIEAQQLKLVTKRSLQQTHISQASGSGADEGTGSIPGVPDVPTDESEEELSWNSTEDEGKDDDGNDDDNGDDGQKGDGGDDDEDDDGEEGDDDDDDQEVERDDEKDDEEEGDKKDESNDGEEDDDDERDDDDDDDDEEEIAKIDEQDDAERGGDDDEETESDEESDSDETREEESFDPIPRIPEDSKDDGNGEEDQGLRISEEERLTKEEEADELYRDVDINQGRGLPLSQDIKDSHVTLTPVNPDGMESIFATASSPVAPLQTSTPIMTPSTIATITTISYAPIPPTPIPSEVLQNLPTFDSVFRFDEGQKSLEASFFEYRQINPFAEAVSNILADETKSYLVGIVKDVEVHIGKLKLLNDFYVIDMKKDPETPLLVGRGFLATANEVIDCRMAKIAIGERITWSVFGVKGVDLGAQTPYYTRKDFLDCHFLGEWEISRDAELNPFKDTLVFRRMVKFIGAIPINLKCNMWESKDLIRKPINWDKPPKNRDSAWHAKIRLMTPMERNSPKPSNQSPLLGSSPKKKFQKRSSTWTTSTTLNVIVQRYMDQQMNEAVKVAIQIQSDCNKSIQRSDEQRNLYKALVKAYESDKIILDTYRETITLKRRHDDDADKDEEPSAGPDRGSKRRRKGKEPESASALKEKETRSAGKSTQGSKSR
nr:hypothetical protein [Tanacetum cinerariifolium]